MIIVHKKYGKLIIALNVLLLLTLACSLISSAEANLTWTTQTVDTNGSGGWWSSLALDSSNNPHISYQDYTNFDLKYAKWTGDEWATEIVDLTGNVSGHSCLALDSLNNPHISYHYRTNDALKYAKGTQPTPTPEGSLDILPTVAIGGGVAAIVVAGIAVYHFKNRKPDTT